MITSISQVVMGLGGVASSDSESSSLKAISVSISLIAMVISLQSIKNIVF